MSDTPRTDENIERIEADETRYEDRFDCWVEMIGFARTLERELAEASKTTSAAMETCAKVTQLRITAEAERDALRVELAEAKELKQFKANLTAELGLVRRERDSFQRMLHVQEENSRRLERELYWAKESVTAVVEKSKELAALREKLFEGRL